MSEKLDPVFVNSRREAWIILGLWGLSFLWTLPYCYQYGYQTKGEVLGADTVFGMPAWVVWGVGLPWVVTGVIAILMCLFVMQNDDLGQGDDEHGIDVPANSAQVSE